MRVVLWLCLASIAMSSTSCRKKSDAGPAPRRDAAVAAPLAAPQAADVSSPIAVADTVTTIPTVPPEPEPPDKVPTGDAPWLSYADSPVRVADLNGERQAVEGELLLPGTVVTLDEGGQAEVDLPDGSVVDLDEMSELLMHTVRLHDGLRQIELTLFAGGARVVVPASPEAGSVFRLTTPVGVVEIAGADVAVEVDGDTGATRVVVFGGGVTVQAGAKRQVVEGGGSQPGGAEIAPTGEVRSFDVTAASLDPWTLWVERQADRLIARYRVDITAPDGIASSTFSVEAHPGWASAIRLRRARIATRAQRLAEALGAGALASIADPYARFEAGRKAWTAKSALPPLAAANDPRPERIARWTARAGQRSERITALRDTLAELRLAYEREHPPQNAAPERTASHDAGVPY
jgi:hypothetical protein